MAVFKCKMCGAQLNIEEGQTVVACDFCGTTQTVPHFDSQKKTNAFKRANDLRFQCEFDKASGIYETIITENPNESEAYWGLVLCKYGIEYVDDPKTKTKIPTCHRTQFNSIFEDEDYNAAIRHSDVVARGVYKREAAAIDTIQKAILNVSSKEEPFDVFICYKETDENGERTTDSVIAQDIYRELVSAGFRVFFARITLEKKLGSEYEPYIFAALHSSKVMLHVTTSKEHSQAVWVKNEWNRYISLINEGAKKTLIPCYRGMSASELPKELAHLQGQDLSKIGAIQDLVYGVKKIIKPTLINMSLTDTNDSMNNDSSVFDALIRKGYTYLKNHKFEQAKRCFENAIETTELCGSGYLGLLLCEYQYESLEELLEQNNLEILEDENYQLAREFANNSCNDTLNRIENKLKYNISKDKYEEALSLINDGEGIYSLENARTLLEELGDFEDSKDKVLEATYLLCQRYIAEANDIQSSHFCDDAVELLEAMVNYKDSKSLLSKAKSKKKKIYDEYTEKCINSFSYDFPSDIDTDCLVGAVNKIRENRNLYNGLEYITPEITDGFNSNQDYIYKQIVNKTREALTRARTIGQLYSYTRALRTLDKDEELIPTFAAIKAKEWEFERKQKAQKRKRNKHILIFASIAVAVVGIAVGTVLGVSAINTANQKSSTYQSATNAMENGNYDQAIQYYKSLGDYERAEQKIKVCEGLNKLKEAISTKSEYAIINGINSIVSGGEKVEVHYDVEQHPIIKRLNESTSGDKTELISRYDFTLYKPTWAGYSFLSWTSNSISYKNNVAYLGLYSNWSVNTYQIEYNLDGGENNEDNPSVYTVETSTIYLRNPTKNGYSFAGWYLGENKVTQIVKGSYQNYLLSAKWEANKYTISFDPNGGSLENTNMDVYFKKDFALPIPSKPHYTFCGWFDEENVRWENGTYEQTNNINLVAHWIADAYSITYELNGGTNSDNPSSYTADDEITLNDPTKEGYTFKGWTDEGGNLVTKIVKGSYGDIKLTAQWELNRYLVSFRNYDGTALYETEAEHGSDVSYYGPVPAKPASQQYTYTWSGWDKPLTNIVSNTVITATFENLANCYTITWLNYDGSLLKEEALEYGAEPIFNGTEPSKPSDSNYDYAFSGWSPELNPVTENVVYTAQFVKEAHYNYYLNGSNKAVITGVTDTSLDYYHVPKSIDGHAVVQVEELRNCANAREITIPDSVELISSQALRGCSSLERIVLPFVGQSCGIGPGGSYAYTEYMFGYIFSAYSFNNATAVTPSGFSNASNYCFYIPSGLKDVEIKNGKSDVWVYPYAFSNNKVVENIHLGKGVTYICDRAFYDSGVINVSLSGSKITYSFGIESFSGCNKLQTIDMGNTVTKIGQGSFNYCSSLKEINFPDSVTSIPIYNFKGCVSLQSISISSLSIFATQSNEKIVIGMLFSSVNASYVEEGFKTITQMFYSTAGQTLVSSCFSVPISLKRITLRKEQTIPIGAFMNLQMEEVVLPKIIMTNKYSFDGFKATKLVLGPSLTTLNNTGGCWNSTGTTVYFEGDSAKWKAVSTTDANFTKTNVYYFREDEPTQAGKWWHYIDGEPTIW